MKRFFLESLLFAVVLFLSSCTKTQIEQDIIYERAVSSGAKFLSGSNAQSVFDAEIIYTNFKTECELFGVMYTYTGHGTSTEEICEAGDQAIASQVVKDRKAADELFNKYKKIFDELDLEGVTFEIHDIKYTFLRETGGEKILDYFDYGTLSYTNP